MLYYKNPNKNKIVKGINGIFMKERDVNTAAWNRKCVKW